MANAAEKSPTRIIALEEAFLHPKLQEVYPPEYLNSLKPVMQRLSDVGPERIRRMDAAGIDLQVLSHIQPGVQTLDRDTAIRLSKEVNDWLGGIVKQYPTRFAGFATLPTQSPQDAADELERTVKQFGFKGALINGHTQGKYMDDPSFSPLFERAQALDVPIYIHPTDPPQAIMDTYYKDYNPAMTVGWGWQVETGTHLLRLMSGGVFDRYPNLKIIVGHMGEFIPFALPRLNIALTLGNWLAAAQTGDQKGKAVMQQSVLYYMKQNVFITTSGVFDQAALIHAIAGVGIDHILFSVDEPMRDNFEAVAFLKEAQLSKEDKEKLAHGNAEHILKLLPETNTRKSSGGSFFAFQAKLKAKFARVALSFLMK
ncbi:MAG: amidohydrolase family protein [Minisyncoccia bacterium]|jgi:predicted TIM-barrel fold metal-dependent hydrolase